MLKNAISSAAENTTQDETLESVLVGLIAQLLPMHLKVLSFARRPSTGSAQTVLLQAFPEVGWEAAARGLAVDDQPGRPWSWGYTDPTPWQMNAEPARLRKTSPVGVFVEADTPEGLCDMAGNVLEWCEDIYRGQYSLNIEPNEHGPESGADRVLRGGCWFDDARYCRSASRVRYGPSERSNNIGFRFAQVIGALAGAERPSCKP